MRHPGSTAALAVLLCLGVGTVVELHQVKSGVEAVLLRNLEPRILTMQQLKTTATTQDGTTVEVITTQKEGETQDELLARHLAMVEKVKASGGE